MGCHKTISGRYNSMTATTSNEMIAKLADEDVYAEDVTIAPDGYVYIYGQMSYSTATNWDELLQEWALEFGLSGVFQSTCDDDVVTLYVGTDAQKYAAEKEDLEAQVNQLQTRLRAMEVL